MCRNYKIERADARDIPGYVSSRDVVCWWEFNSQDYAGMASYLFSNANIYIELPDGTTAAQTFNDLPFDAQCDFLDEHKDQLDSCEVASDLSANGCTGSPDSYGGVNFTSACNAHDNCYSSFGSTQASCDNAFRGNLHNACVTQTGGKFVNINWEGYIGSLPNPRYVLCNNFLVTTYYTFVDNFGSGFYNAAQDAAKCNILLAKKEGLGCE